MAYQRVCAAKDIDKEDMAAFTLEGTEVLVVRDGSGELHAMDGACPHEDFPLVDGLVEGTVLTCGNHLWSFDVTTGNGISPPNCRLRTYAVKVEDGAVYVDTGVSLGEAS